MVSGSVSDVCILYRIIIQINWSLLTLGTRDRYFNEDVIFNRNNFYILIFEKIFIDLCLVV